MSEIQTLQIPGITDPATLACIARSRTFSQYCGMVENALADPPRCPFCKPDPKRNPIIFETDHCLSWPCTPAEKNTRFHFLIVPKEHVTGTGQLNMDQVAEMFDLKDRLQVKFGFKSAGILIRDGDATLLAGTIEHLHMHVMVPDGTGRVESPFYKGVEDEAASLARALIFEKMRRGDTTTREEQELVQDRLK